MGEAGAPRLGGQVRPLRPALGQALDKLGRRQFAHLAPLALWDEVFRATLAVKASEGVYNSAFAMLAMARLAMERLAQLEEQTGDAQGQD